MLGVGLESDRSAMGLLSTTRVLEGLVTLHSTTSQHPHSQLCGCCGHRVARLHPEVVAFDITAKGIVFG